MPAAIPEALNMADGFLFARLREELGEKTAILCGDRVLTYADMGRLAARFGDALREPTVWYPILMLTVRARVKGGRLYVDDPVDLPEDAEVTLAVIAGGAADESDDMDAGELARLNDALEAAEAQFQRGEYVTAEALLVELRANAARR